MKHTQKRAGKTRAQALPLKKRADTAPANRMKFSEALFRRVIDTVGNGSLIGPAIQREGISRTAFYRHIEEDREKREALKRAQIYGPVAAMESEAYRRALEGRERPVFYKGLKCGSIRDFSDTMLIFLLKKWHPAVYDDRPTLSVSTVVNGPHEDPLRKEHEARIAAANELGRQLMAKFEAKKNAQQPPVTSAGPTPWIP